MGFFLLPRIGAFVILAWAAAPLGVSAESVDWTQRVRLPSPEIETLPNGLTVAWFVDARLPVLDLAMLVQSGFRSDPAGKSGTASLLAELLDRGSQGWDAARFAREVERLGASRYTAADDESMTIGMHGLSEDAPALLGFLAKMAMHPDFPASEFEKEKARHLERLAHVGDSAQTLAAFAFQRAMTSGTAYARGEIRSLSELRRVTRADLADFHRKHFTPKNSVLMIVGRVERASFKAELMKLFGAWTGERPEATAVIERNPRFESAGVDHEVLLADRPGANQAHVKVGVRASGPNSTDRHALAVANALFGEYFNSRLNSAARDQLGLTYAIWSAFSHSRELSTFSVTSSTRQETVGELLNVILAQMKEFQTGAFREEEVRMAKEYLAGGFPVAMSTLAAVASRWLAGYVYALGPDELNEYLPKVSRVTPAQVQAAVRRSLDFSKLTITVSGDAKRVEPVLKKAKFKIKRVRAADLL